MISSVELFTGTGGLALGLAKAGFRHRLLVEFNRDACQTLRRNFPEVGLGTCALHEGDVAEVDFASYREAVDVLAAGAPCQPFSLGGKHRAHQDRRNLFPQVFRAQRELRPSVVVVENVKGLLRQSFADFVEYIELQLALPDLLPADENDPASWHAHLPRLRTAARNRQPSAEGYVVRKHLLNAADYGVPQVRERVFIVAVREELGMAWERPSATHSLDRLLIDKWVTGDYWKRHGLRRPRAVPDRLRQRVDALRSHSALRLIEDEPTRPWRTVRDAIAGMPSPVDFEEAEGWLNHRGQPGARSYPGHTGSPIDEPAKTLKAGVHGVPGGENMLRREDGTVRYFTVREAARIQSFPDEWAIAGAWGEAMRQLGNAVPVDLAAAVGRSLAEILGRKRSGRSKFPLVAVA